MKSQHYLIDTSVLVSLVISFMQQPIHESEQKLIDIFSDLGPEHRIIPLFVITEFLTLCQKGLPFRYNYTKEQAQTLINLATELTVELEDISNIYFPQFDEFQLALEKFVHLQNTGRSKNISFVDTFLVTIAKENKWKILTNDKSLTNL